MPIFVFLGLSVLDLGPMYATVRQTPDAYHRLMPPTVGAGHNKVHYGCLQQLCMFVSLLLELEPVSSFQCSDKVGLATGMTSVLWKNLAPAIPEGSYLGDLGANQPSLENRQHHHYYYHFCFFYINFPVITAGDALRLGRQP